jgi:hypothetical protein
MKILLIIVAAVGLSSCSNLTTDQNDRILDSAIPVVSKIIIRATK